VPDRASPIRHILRHRLAASGIQLVHAAAVGLPEGGVLIVGKSGSGKSTTSLSTLGSELLYAGDDFVGVGVDGSGQTYVHSLSGSANLETRHLPSLQGLRVEPRHVQPSNRVHPNEKTVFYVGESYPGRLVRGFPLRAIVLPAVSPGEATRTVEAPRGAALTSFMSTMFAFPDAGQDTLSAVAGIARAVPTLSLRLGERLDGVGPLLLEAIHAGTDAAAAAPAARAYA
jgi:hypothetical protein